MNTHQSQINSKWLFKASFIALIATSFAFVTRFAVLADWGRQFNLSSTQMGEIGGAGVWPFAITEPPKKITLVVFLEKRLLIQSISIFLSKPTYLVCHRIFYFV